MKIRYTGQSHIRTVGAARWDKTNQWTTEVSDVLGQQLLADPEFVAVVSAVRTDPKPKPKTPSKRTTKAVVKPRPKPNRKPRPGAKRIPAKGLKPKTKR